MTSDPSQTHSLTADQSAHTHPRDLVGVGVGKAERPKAPWPATAVPGPSIEDELRDVIAGSRQSQRERERAVSAMEAAEKEALYAAEAEKARRRAIAAQRLPAYDAPRASDGDLYAAAAARRLPAPPPTGGDIAQRLSLLRNRLLDVADKANGIAGALAGHSDQAQTASELNEMGGLFSIYARFLDEIGAIVDNIEREQARAREAIG